MREMIIKRSKLVIPNQNKPIIYEFDEKGSF